MFLNMAEGCLERGLQSAVGLGVVCTLRLRWLDHWLKCQPQLARLGTMKTMIQAELPPELTAQALAFVKNGWASDFNELLADALIRFLESHSARVTESMVMSDVQWGLHGKD